MERWRVIPVEEMEKKIRENKLYANGKYRITETPQQLKAVDEMEYTFEMKFTLDLEETDADRVELKLKCGKKRKIPLYF